MSSNAAPWPVVVPGFMYIVKMGDFTHILQPGDQKSSEHLNLAQSAIRDIAIARNLLNERGPFLLLDKQQKMHEMIAETETAISRVIMILRPARVEHISEQSIRFNTENPWALRDGPRSAATFGRLQTTHDALKTVVHDLNDIEATAQQDDCEGRANAAVDTTNVRPAVIPAAIPDAIPIAVPTAVPTDARGLMTWKRSRRAHRHVENSNRSSISDPAASEPNMNDFSSPVSPEARFTRPQLAESSIQARRESTSTPNSLSHIDNSPDHVSDVSVDRLPVIHELEGGGSIVQLGPVRAFPATAHEADGNEPVAELLPFPQEPRNIPNHVPPAHRRSMDSTNRPNPSFASPPALRVTPPTLKESKGMRKEGYGEYRRRGRESRQSSNQSPNSASQPPVPNPYTTQFRDPNIDNATYQAPGRFHSLKARSPARQMVLENSQPSNVTMVNGRLQQIPQGQQMPQASNPATGQVASTTRAMPQQIQAQHYFRQNGETSVWTGKSATYPPVQTQPNPSGRTLGQASQDPTSQDHILSPSRTQMSPYEQTQSPDVPHPTEPPPPPPLSPPPTPLRTHQKTFEIMDIDPELTRMPSLLQAARARRQGNEARSLPASQASPDRRTEENSTQQVVSLSTPVRSPPDRSGTAPPLSHPSSEASRPFAQDLSTRDEFAHLRSMSDTAVPQINVVRAPTVPRKPLPYQQSPLPSRESSAHSVSRIGTPAPQRPRSEMIQSSVNIQHDSGHGSGPPSPIHSENPQSLAPQRPRASSVHSLTVHAPSSGASSRRSSISAEESAAVITSAPNRPPKTNGLAMNPPSIPDRQTSAYRAQTLAQAKIQSTVPQQDYRSPAWLQGRHPNHNVAGESLPTPNTDNVSRFRDQDQVRGGGMNPVRGHTVPLLHQGGENPALPADQPRGSSEQARSHIQPQQHVNEQSNRRPSPSPQRSADGQTQLRQGPNPQPIEHTKPSFLRNQAAKLDARRQTVPVAQPAARTQPEQAVNAPRPVLTSRQPTDVTHPPPRVDPNHTARIAPVQSPMPAGIINQNANRRVENSSARNDGPANGQVIRPPTDQPPPEPRPAPATVMPLPAPSSFGPAPPPTSLPPIPVPREARQQHPHAPIPSPERQLSDESQISQVSQPMAKLLRDSVAAYNELSQSANPTLAPPQNNAVDPGPTPRQTKKRSWLSHQAGKYAGRATT